VSLKMTNLTTLLWANVAVIQCIYLVYSLYSVFLIVLKGSLQNFTFIYLLSFRKKITAHTLRLAVSDVHLVAFIQEQWFHLHMSFGGDKGLPLHWHFWKKFSFLVGYSILYCRTLFPYCQYCLNAFDKNQKAHNINLSYI
jgi:hypothetical protein